MNPSNAKAYLDAGASHVIVTSYVFKVGGGGGGAAPMFLLLLFVFLPAALPPSFSISKDDCCVLGLYRVFWLLALPAKVVSLLMCGCLLIAFPCSLRSFSRSVYPRQTLFRSFRMVTSTGKG